MQENSERENSERSADILLKKKYKFFRAILKWFFAPLLILFIALFFLVQSSAVQTWLAKKVAVYLSDELHVPVEIEAVSIGFFNSASLNGLLIRDLHNDTLVYAGKLYVKTKKVDFFANAYELEVSGLENSVVRVKRYDHEKDFNFQFLVNYFSSKENKKDTTSNLKIDFGKLKLKQINFSYTDYNGLVASSSMNFSDIGIRDLNGIIDEIKISSDSIALRMSDFSFREKSGFVVRDFSSNLLVCPTNIYLKELVFRSDHSYLHGNFQTLQSGFDEFSGFADNISMNLEFMDSTHIGVKDLNYFAGTNFKKGDHLYLKGKIKGKVNDIIGKEIQMNYGTNTCYLGNFSVTDITKPDQMYLHLNIKKLSTVYKDLVELEIPETNEAKRKEIFSSLKPLGNITYVGKIDGFISEIASKGTLNTAIGTIQCDASLTNLTDSSAEIGYSGFFAMKSLDIGKFLNNHEIGKLSANLEVEGSGTSLDNLNSRFDFKVQSMVVHQYDYHSIEAKGEFSNKKFNGFLASKDTNANFTFNGLVNFNDKYADMDFKSEIKNLDFVKLNFGSSKDTVQRIHSKMEVNLRGNDLTNLSGKMFIDSFSYTLNSKTYFLASLNLLLNQSAGDKNINVKSDFVDIDIAGKFNLTDIPNSFRKFTENYFPTFIKESKIPKNKILTDKFTCSVRLKNFSKINGLLAPELNISDGTSLFGRFDMTKNELSLQAKSEKIAFGKIIFSDCSLNGFTKENSIVLSSGARLIKITDSLYFEQLGLTTMSSDTSSDFSFVWNNASRQRNSGEIRGKVNFNNERLLLKLLKMDIAVADSLWSLSGVGNSISFDTSNVISISDLNIINGEQEIKSYGKISVKETDKVHLELLNFKIAQLNSLVNSVQLKLDGKVSGFCDMSGVFDKLIFTSDFNFNKVYLNEKELGAGKITSFYDARRDVVGINGFFSKGNSLNGVEFKNIDFTGEYFPSKVEDNLDLTASFNTFDITIFQPYVKGIITFAKQRGGTIEGNVYVKGKISKPIINGKIKLAARNFKIDYLNTTYTANGIIKIFPDKIQFGDDEATFTKLPEPITISEKDGHDAQLWGNIFHDNFSITKLDFDINAKNIQALNTTAANNSGYFGKAYVSGNIGLYGDLDNINLNLNLKTEKNTEFNIPLSGPATVEESDYMFFVKKDTLQKNQRTYIKSLSGINLNFNLEATRDANVKLIFDSKSGDVIQARGSGNINMVINTNGKFEMSGLYTLEDGNYLFSLENLLSKKFDIISGSTIKWTGDPLNADINITAGYNQNSSLAPFFPSDSTGIYSKPVRASVLLNMKEKLLTPDISFGIQLPTVDETTRQTVLGYVNNEQELNRQVFSLLLLKSFVTPLQLSNQGVGVGAGSAASRTSSEMLSNQLSNWLSQLSTNVDISVTITPEQMDVALSKQLFNDRLSIDGNVGVNNAAGQKTTNMIGDLQVEYKVYPDGKLRVKGFNKSNDNTQISTLGGPFTQGMGVFYREEFNTVDELYEKYLGWVRKRKRN